MTTDFVDRRHARELVLPTTIAGRGPLSAANFLTVLAGTRVTAHAGDTPATGVRP